MERITPAEWSIPLWMLRGNPNSPYNQEDAQSKQFDKVVHPPRRYRCRNCQTPIAFISDEIPIDELGAHSIQINPNGFVHEVITVRCTQHTLSLGTPVPADSWFPGFCWRYLICDHCTEFLGWSYSKPMELAMAFAGLSRTAIILDQPED